METITKKKNSYLESYIAPLRESSPILLWHKWASGMKFLAQGNNSNRTGILGIEPKTFRLEW